VTISEQSVSETPPSGFGFVGQQVEITAPDATIADPLVLTFRLHNTIASLSVDIFKDAVLVPGCTDTSPGASAAPNPCVESRTLDVDDIVIVVRTKTASNWNFGVSTGFDSDGDGVADSADACPDTAAGIQVDGVGCPLDSDHDGVSDDKDMCRTTPAGAEVDIYGCELDDDDDGVFNSRDKCPDSSAGVRIDISGCEIRDIIALSGVNFASNSDRLLTGAEYVLAQAAATLRKHPDLRVEVAGHTDSNGSAEANVNLSVRRAITVRDYLIRAGANAANLTSRGYGEIRPVSDNTTAQGRTENRRVELIILNR
jgi:outer membrane protein OmpA-like peptidoglycan-associated protein